MMYPERMERVTIVTPTKHVKQVIEILYKHRALHIIDHTKTAVDIGSPLPSSTHLAELLVKTRSLIHSLDIKKQPDQELVGDLDSQITLIYDKTIELLSRQQQLEQTLRDLGLEQAAYEELRWLKVDPVKLRDSKHLTYYFGVIKDSKQLESALAAITPKHYLELQPEGQGILLLVENEKAKQCRELLVQRGFSAADHNRIVNLTKHLDQHLEDIRAQVTAAKHELETTRKELGHISAEQAGFLTAAESLLAVEAKKAQTPLRFGITKHACFINGWVPQQQIILLTASLEQELADEVYVQRIDTKEEAPVRLENPVVVAPFETIIKLYTLPRYAEIDPSTLLFLSFPLFFGFMLGDIGYGLLLLVLASIIRSKAKGEMARSIGGMLIMSAVATVIFGAVFGEFFGTEQLGSFAIPYLIHRAEDMNMLLGVAVVIGVLHITIALIIGFINEKHYRGAWKAFCAKISWILLLAAAGIAGASYLFHLPLMLAAAALGVISITLIAIGEGVKGLVELPGIFSNVLSYTRLMALGVASAALAVVVNEMAGTLFRSGTIIAILAALLVLLLGHAVNFGLGILGPFLHSLRLHYVEFFSKFYEGGGKPYKPFGSEEA